MLNAIWCGFFLVGAAAGLYQWLVLGDHDIFRIIVESIFMAGEIATKLIIALIGTLCFWLGLLEVAKQAGIIDKLAHMLNPLLHRLMPDIPKDHPSFGHITMNIAANMLGLDNAATPMGIKAMQSMQEVNTEQHIASNSQIMFLVINTSSVTLLPVTLFMYRASLGADDPTLIYIPILIATSLSTLAAITLTGFIQRISFRDPVILSYLLGFLLLLGSLIYSVTHLDGKDASDLSSLLGNGLIFGIIIGILLTGLSKGQPVYDHFITGAKEGFQVAVTIIPYLVAMLIAIAVFRVSGAFDSMIALLQWIVTSLGGDTRFIQALPTAFMKPFSGSGARAMMLDTMNELGVDAFPSLIAQIVVGSTETTFYVLAVYFGAVRITHGRHAIGCGLFADLVGISAAIMIGYWFFL